MIKKDVKRWILQRKCSLYLYHLIFKTLEMWSTSWVCKWSFKDSTLVDMNCGLHFCSIKFSLERWEWLKFWISFAAVQITFIILRCFRENTRVSIINSLIKKILLREFITDNYMMVGKNRVYEDVFFI